MPGIYLHIPFCAKKCDYCDFFSVTETEYCSSYTESAIKEMRLRAENPKFRDLVYDSIYIGGGTPSLMPAKYIADMLSEIRKLYKIDVRAEISTESNPGSLTPEKLDEYRRAGINRISIGVQSFIDEELKTLGRIHTAESAIRAVKDARVAGFDNISLDLIFEIPGQTRESWLYTLNKAVSLRTEHISAYSLIYEESTVLFNRWKKGTVKRHEEDFGAELFELTNDILVGDGYSHYEISNYAKPDKVCRHNMNYWNGGAYLAFGPSAHGFDGSERYWNVKSVKGYSDFLNQGKLPVDGSEIIGAP